MDGQLTIPEINQDRILLLTAAAFFGGTKALREFLLQARPDFKKPELFKQCLDSEKDDEFLKSLFSDQKQLLFPETIYPDVHTLDITLLGKVIRACTKCGAEELIGTAFKCDQNLEDPVYCKKRIKDLNLSTGEEALLCSALAKRDVTKDGLVVLRKLIKFLKTEKSKIQVKNEILELNRNLINYDDFKQFYKDRKDLKVGDQKCLYQALCTGDVSKVTVDHLGKLLTALEKDNVPTHRRANLNQEESFEDFALSLSRDLPKEDYECVRLMETCRNEMAHWGDKELPEDKYRAYFAALEVILKNLKFDVATELRPFKAGVASQEGAILEGRILANYAKQQDEIHSLKDKQIALEEQIRNLQAELSYDIAKQQEEIKCLQLQVEVIDGKYDSFCDRLVGFTTGIADLKEFTTETTKKLVEDMESSNEVLRGMKMELDVLKNRVDALEENQREQESRIVRLEKNQAEQGSMIHGLKVLVDQNAADIEGVNKVVTKLRDNNSKDRPKLSDEEWSEKKQRMQKNGLEWVKRQVVTDPSGRRQRNVELKIRVDPVLVENPEEDVSRVEGKSEHEIMMISKRKIQRIVAYKDIISTETQVTFVRAVGGGGKSTLSITLYHLWCTGEILQDFDFVVLLQARVLNAHDISSASQNIVDDLLRTDPVFRKCNVNLEDLLSSEKRVLFIVDGLDELVVQDELIAKVSPSKWKNPTPLGKGLGSLVDAVIEGRQCSILFLGRHAACMKLEKAWQARKMRTRLFELAGYSREKIRDYVSKFAEGNRDVESRLMGILRSSPSLMNLVSIPLYLWVFCSVYSEFKSVIAPTTETELMIYMLLCFFKWHTKVADLGDDLSQLEFFELLARPELIQLVSTLSKVAYDHLSKNELIFAVDDPSKLLPYGLDRSGLLIASKTPLGWRCQFKHKTLHELLAAVYIASGGIEKADVLSNDFLQPCLPFVCAFQVAMVENSKSPLLVQSFVKRMLPSCKESPDLDYLLKNVFLKAVITEKRRTFLQEQNLFFKCYKEYHNFVQLEPCIPYLDASDLILDPSSELKKYFLRDFSGVGIVRKMRIYLDGVGGGDVDEWLKLCEGLCTETVAPHRRLVEVQFALMSGRSVSTTEVVKAVAKTGRHFEACCVSDHDLHLLRGLAEMFGVLCPSPSLDFRFRKYDVACKSLYQRYPIIRADTVDKLLCMEFRKPSDQSKLRLLTFAFGRLHMQVFLDSVDHLNELGIANKSGEQFIPYSFVTDEQLMKVHRTAPRLQDKLIFLRLSRVATKDDADSDCGDIAGGFELLPDQCCSTHNHLVLVLRTRDFFDIARVLRSPISQDLVSQSGDIIRLALTKDDLFLSAWLILYAWFLREAKFALMFVFWNLPIFRKFSGDVRKAVRAFLTPHKECLIEEEPLLADVLFPESGNTDLSLPDVRMLTTIILVCTNWKRSDALIFDLDEFLFPVDASFGDCVYLMRCWMNELVQMGPTEGFFLKFDKFSSAIDTILYGLSEHPFVFFPSVIFSLPRSMKNKDVICDELGQVS